MTIIRWDSFFDEAALRNLDVAALRNLMSQLPGETEVRSRADLTRGAWMPAVDIYSNGNQELVLKAELPDMQEDGIELTIEDNTLTLGGERKLDADGAQEPFYRMERRYGSFSRTFALPPTVDAGKASADYKAGVLTVRLPLREEARPRQIKVEAAA